MMAASLLHRGVSILKGCPRIADVFWMEKILSEIGAVTWWEGHDLYLDCTNADKTEISGVYTGKMRSSVILLGAMLGRNKKGCLGYPGGCVIGKRPIDLHILALKAWEPILRSVPFSSALPAGSFREEELFFQGKA